MARFTRFEEIDAWRQARELTQCIYRSSNTGPFAKDFAFRDQMRRAAVSIMSNIAEGFERGGNKEFVHFLSIAKGSCGELRAQRYVAADLQYIDLSTFQILSDRAEAISKMIAGLISYLQRSPLKGSRFKD